MKTTSLTLLIAITLMLTACGENKPPQPYTKRIAGYTLKGQYSPSDLVIDTITMIDPKTLQETTEMRINRARVGRWELYRHDTLCGYAEYKDGHPDKWHMPDNIPESMFLYDHGDTTDGN
jgi:hypothetical protein